MRIAPLSVFALASVLSSNVWALRNYTHGACMKLDSPASASALLQRAEHDTRAAKADEQGVNTVFYMVKMKPSTHADLSTALQLSQRLIHAIQTAGDSSWPTYFEFKVLEHGQSCSEGGTMYIEYDILLNEVVLTPAPRNNE